jgi:hypothetical protein
MKDVYKGKIPSEHLTIFEAQILAHRGPLHEGLRLVEQHLIC